MLASFPSCSGRGNGRWPNEMLYGNGSWRDSNFIPVDAVGLKGECGDCMWAYDDAVRFAS